MSRTIDDLYIINKSRGFDAGVMTLVDDVEKALKALQENPSDSTLLADYQAKLSELTVYRNAQSSVVKAYKDLDTSIIQNFR